MSTQEHEATAEKVVERIYHQFGPGRGEAKTMIAAALADAVRPLQEQADRLAKMLGTDPSILEEALEYKLIEVADAVRVALVKYGMHLPHCRTWGDGKPPCACGLDDLLGLRAGEGDATAIRPHPFYQDALPREKGLCDYTELNGDGCAEPPESTIHQGDATAKPTNRWGIESDGDTVDLRGKMSGGLSMPVKLEGDATPGPEPRSEFDERLKRMWGGQATPPKKGRPRKKCEDCWCHPSIKNFERQVHCEDCAPPSEER